jgi:hypothetical protein
MVNTYQGLLYVGSYWEGLGLEHLVASKATLYSRASNLAKVYELTLATYQVEIERLRSVCIKDRA